MKIRKTIKILFTAVALIAIGYFSAKIFFSNSGNVETTATISNERSQNGKVLGEDQNLATNYFSSQNYRTPQITFGGDAVTVPSGDQSVAPEIKNLRSELLVTKSDQQVKFHLSWKTNKPCQASVEYLKEGQPSGKTISEDGYGFIHSAEIAPLNYSTTYSYSVTARDKWGNEIKSDKLAFYTGAPNVSIFDLLGSAFKDMFGWAVKKQ